MNYSDYLFDIPDTRLDNTVLIDAGTDASFTGRQLQERVINLAAGLEKKGFRPGQVIATHLYNSAGAVIAHLAVQYLGGITCLLDPLVTEAGLTYYLEDVHAAGLMTRCNKDDLSGVIPGDLTVIDADEVASLSETESPGARTEPWNYEPGDPAALFYTSGTTSRPKGVVLSPENFEAHYRIFTRSCYSYEPSDRLLCFVPFSHGYGSKSIFIPCLKAGAAMVIMRSFHPVRVAELVEKYGITHLFGVPSHYQQLLRKEEFIDAMRRLKAAFSAAALLKLETAREWSDRVGFPLDEGYGLIETCTGVAFRMGSVPDRLGHIGTYPPELVQVEIMDDSGRILERGERGEIAVRGRSVMQGYLNRPEETARVLWDGWFRTGDLGYKTERNEIILAGRIKDVINVAGIKVAPFEIEAVLNEHPKVAESAVLGVEDDMYGEVVMAFIKPADDTDPDERELKRYLQKHLINFQIPREIVCVREFPRNNMGKIDKNALRELKRKNG